MSERTSDFLGTDRFKIRRRLGSGGMGVVYEAHDRETDKVLALKALTRTEASHIYRFKREFRALADVAHPNLVSLYEFMSDGNFWFFTMELVRGVTFIEYVRPGFRSLHNQASGEATLMQSVDSATRTDHEAETVELAPSVSQAGGWDDSRSYSSGDLATITSTLNLERLRAALLQLAEGLHSLHESGKLHRDLKPSNVLVTREGRVVILDFGLVADVEEKGLHDSVSIVGTPEYMSPEQGAQLSVSKASDWYSIGVMLYQALTGRLPFSGKYFQVMFDKQQRDPPQPIKLVPDLPRDLNDLCVRLLRRKPEARPSGRQVLSFLRSEKRDSAASPPPPNRRSLTPALPFIGRSRHLVELKDAFAATRQGQTVKVYVHGESGMGKTSLVKHFLDELREEADVVILEGRCYERESVPYKALDGVIDSLSRYLMSLRRATAEALMPRDAYSLARLFPVMLQVDQVFDAPQREMVTPDPLALRRQAFAALRELFARIADRRPLVLWIDDLHWADEDSTFLLEDLLRPPDAPPLLLLATFRTEELEAKKFLQTLLENTGTATCLEISVAPLSNDEAGELLRAMFDPELPANDPLVEPIVKEACGNPFLLDQLARYALSTDRSASMGITLGVMLSERLRSQPQGARRLTATLAVAGRPINSEVAYQAAGLTGDELPLIGSLRAAQFLRGGGSDFGVELYHDRIREAILAQLDPTKIKQIHRRLAQTIEARGVDDPEALYEHYLGADERVRAAGFAAVAASRAAGALAFDRAAAFYRRALKLAPTRGAEQIDLKIGLAQSLVNAGRPVRAAEAFLDLAQLTTASRSLDFKRRAAEQLLLGGHIKEGLAVFDSILSLAGFKLARGPRQALLSLLLRRLQIRLRGHGFVERDPSQIPEADLFRIDICWAIAAGLGAVDLIRGADFQARHLLLALRAGEPYRISRAMSFETAQIVAAVPTQRKRAVRIAQQAEALAHQVGNPHAIGLSLWATGISAYLLGRWKKAAAVCEQATEILRDRCQGVMWEMTIAQRFMLSALMYLGEVAEVGRRVPVLLATALDQGNLFAATDLRTRLNLIWLAADNPDQALLEVIAALKAWPQEDFHLQHYSSMVALAQIELYTGDAEVAWKHVNGQWAALKKSMLLRIQGLRIEALNLRARTALATVVAGNVSERDRLLAVAEKLARRIAKEKMPWSDPLVPLIRAAIANNRRQTERTTALLSDALEGFELADMALHAAAVRRRLGQVLGNDRGRALMAEADQWMAGQKIKNPTAMTRMLAPGWGQ